MRTAQFLVLALAAAVVSAACADEGAGAGRRASPPERPAWEFGLTAYPTFVRDGENYTSVIAVADRGALHLEARYNYESIGARSAFVGWTFSGGEGLHLGADAAAGRRLGRHARICSRAGSEPWLEVDRLLRRRLSMCAAGSRCDDSYLYAWSELGYSPFEWLRVGLAGQRTNAYDSGRDIQRGPFVQFTWRRVTVGGYWFNPGSDDQIVVSMIGVSF